MILEDHDFTFQRQITVQIKKSIDVSMEKLCFMEMLKLFDEAIFFIEASYP